jgi:hypothetical protein
MLPVNVAENSPFSILSPLGTAIENRPQSEPASLGSAVHQPWLQRLGEELQRVAVDDEDDRRAFQALGGELSQTSWHSAARLEIVPYIDGTPVGTARSAQAVLDRQHLYVKQGSLASVARAVAQELGRFFANADVVDAIKLCFARDPEYVTEYMKAHFTLAPHDRVPVDPVPAAPTDSLLPWDQPEDTQDDGGYEDLMIPHSETTDGVPVQRDNEGNWADDEGTTATEDSESPHNVRPRRRRSHVAAGIMDRFALQQGFSKQSSDCFGHADGSAIKKNSESTFPWERLGPAGDSERYYYALDHCLELDPLQLRAELWGLLQRFPDRYALVLADPAGKPIELDGGRLKSLVKSGKLTLHPATLRFVYSTE